MRRGPRSGALFLVRTLARRSPRDDRPPAIPKSPVLAAGAPGHGLRAGQRWTRFGRPAARSAAAGAFRPAAVRALPPALGEGRKRDPEEISARPPGGAPPFAGHHRGPDGRSVRAPLE